MKAFSVYLILVMWVGVKAPWIALLLSGYFLVTKSIPNKTLFAVLVFLFLLRTDIQICEPIEHGRIVRLNRSSVLVQNGFTKVLVHVQDVAKYAMHDQLKLYALNSIDANMNQEGFDPIDWAKANGICYRSAEADTYRIDGTGFFNRLSKGGLNPDKRFVQEIRVLLFQSDPEEIVSLWISMGLIYLAILDMIKRICIHFKSIWVERVLSIAFLIWVGSALGMPLVLVRILISTLVGMFIEDRMLKWALCIFICLWLAPYGSTQLAFIFPFSLQAVVLFVEKKYVRWVRSCVAIWCLLASMKRVSLLGLALFPIHRILHLMLVIMGVLSSILPFLQGAFSLVYSVLDQWFIFVQGWLVLRSRVSMFWILIFIIVWHLLRKRSFMLNLSALVVFNALIIWGSYPWFYTVSMLYVGQGDAFLLQAPFNQSVILIDTGPPTQYANLKASLDHRGIHRIDHLIITHDDADHNGNVEALRKDYRIQNTIQLGKDIQDKWFHLKYLPVRDAKEDNDLSLVYHVQIESVRFLFMGDLGIAGELQLIKNNPDLKSDVLKLGHHGSKTSSSLMFLERVQARIALISAGKNNYGHPSRDVMERLERLAIRPLVSQTSGTVQIVITRWFRFIWVRYNLFAFF